MATEKRLFALFVLGIVSLFWIFGLSVKDLSINAIVETQRTSSACIKSPPVPVSSQATPLSYKKYGLCDLAAAKLGEDFLSSASHWWTWHLEDILVASKNSDDPRFLHKEWMSKLLATFTPEMLQQSVRVKPLAASFQQLLDLVQDRLLNPDSAEPIKIAVLGGSVTQGRGCPNPPVRVEGYNSKHTTFGKCAWAHRLQVLINSLAGRKLVQVYNLAVGGTNSDIATPLVKYWLYPQSLLPEGPDVIISAYSTNEQHVNNRRDTTISTQFADSKRESVQNFIQAVHDARPCDKSPALLFLDDYIGNQQDRILGETVYNKIVTEMAEWYGDILHVSFADAV
eukprot:scaffold1872_cov262-Amphora_coffeaeformis.AAC.6